MTLSPDAGTRGRADVSVSDQVSDTGGDGGEAPTLDARSLTALKKSPLARKIIAFNLFAILALVATVFLLNPFRNSLIVQREAALANEAALLSGALSVQLSHETSLHQSAPATLRLALLAPESHAIVFDRKQNILAEAGDWDAVPSASDGPPSTEAPNAFWTDAIRRARNSATVFFSPGPPDPALSELRALIAALASTTMEDGTNFETERVDTNGAILAAASSIIHEGEIVGAVGLISRADDFDRLAATERAQMLKMLIVAIIVSVGLSLGLAATIARPLSEIARAAEIARETGDATTQSARVRLPDLSDRSDEIGRLSTALRGMVSALYDRIEANEQFAADVAHELKNPLASLHSAVGSLRHVEKPEQRALLLNIVEHDVRRLDRLVSDISNASRLDSELVKEEEKSFDLLATIATLSDHLGRDAREKDIDFIVDLPRGSIFVRGLESRLAQVFVNLISNAISFCEDGDAIRLWARSREDRVLIVVEDTGPGISEGAEQKIFDRFYSDRLDDDFGNNSGLGLAISKQIVEAHDGVIWAENIRPDNPKAPSHTLGARFVIGLPV